MKLSYKICNHFPAPLSLEAKDLMLHAEGLESENDELKARVKELEVELSKLKRSYDIMSAYAVHYVPEHKTQELIKDVNEAYK